MTLAEKLRMEGREEGEIIGIEKGEIIGIEKGEIIGIEKGEVIGRIQLYHEILGEIVPSKEKLSLNSIEILRDMLKEIEKRWMNVAS
ncbi:hypothetical protein [Desulfamplus magnetovallimortis]|nr:hypothetical protein [Desulfamplus magnetovallimortis]